MKTKIKRTVLRWLVRDFLNAVTIDDLLREERGKVFIGKRQLTREEIATLQSEAKSFSGSLLWKLINYNLYWIANFKMIHGADKEIEMTNGRMMTLCIQTIQDFIDKLKTYK